MKEIKVNTHYKIPLHRELEPSRRLERQQAKELRIATALQAKTK